METMLTTNITKINRMKVAEDILGRMLKKHSIYHWYYFLPSGQKIDYWPTTNKWRIEGHEVIRKGTPKDLLTFIEAFREEFEE